MPKSNAHLLRQNKETAHNFKGYKGIYAGYLHQARKGAKSRGLPYPVVENTQENKEYLWGLVTENCPLSGLPLTFPKTGIDRTATASLDRIDSSKGYIKGNVRWVHKTINHMKWNLTDEEFLDLACEIAALNPFPTP